VKRIMSPVNRDSGPDVKGVRRAPVAEQVI
jgi:hypothetical protein